MEMRKIRVDELKPGMVFDNSVYIDMNNILVKNDRTKNIVTNSGKGWAGGIDVSFIKRVVNKSYGQISYSYSISKRKDNNGEGIYYSDFDQPRDLGGRLSLDDRSPAVHLHCGLPALALPA